MILSLLPDEELVYELNLCHEILNGVPDGLRARLAREEYSNEDIFKNAVEMWEKRLALAESELMSRYLLTDYKE